MIRYILRSLLILSCGILIVILYHNRNQSPVKKIDSIEDIAESYSNETRTIDSYHSAKVLNKGDTIYKLLKSQQLCKKDISGILTLLKKSRITNKLRVGQEVVFHYQGDGNGSHKLNKISIIFNQNLNLDIVRDETNKSRNLFALKKISVPLRKLITKIDFPIRYNLIESMRSTGIDYKNISSLVKIYNDKINFKKNLKDGDRATVVIEKFIRKDGELSHYGNIIYANLKLSKNNYEAYSFKDANNELVYLDSGGNNYKHTSNYGISMPVKKIRITSPFGYRTHPILGIKKMHNGVDFAAPRGTPIYAVSSGSIKEIGWKGGFGRYISINHGNGIESEYAHISRFANNIHKNTRVNKGQVIAYVGSTGRATGPHLHFGVKINKRYVNPMSTKLRSKSTFGKTYLATFKSHKLKVDKLVAKLNGTVDIAYEQYLKSRYR